MKGRLSDLTYSRDGTCKVTVELNEDFGERYDELWQYDVDIEIKKWFARRSLNANAYFHVLNNAIARQQGISEDECKKELVLSYGALAKDDNNQVIGFKLPQSVNVDRIYPYCKLFDTREESGKLFNCYLVYKHTHELDTSEMAKLIDGTVYEAQTLGIETATPEEINRMKALWQN